MASENDPTTLDTTADAVLAVEVPEVAPTEKPKRRRATKKAAAPAAEPDAGAVTSDAAPSGSDDEVAEAPSAKATRKRAAKKAPAKTAA
jgi:ribonuclease E